MQLETELIRRRGRRRGRRGHNKKVDNKKN
jgi:hypothetical protein